MRARDNSFAVTASSLWNTLPREVRDVTGVSVDTFKRKLDKILKHYPDEPRCSASGIWTNAQGRKSNSLCDLSKHPQVKLQVRKSLEEEKKMMNGGLSR